MVIREFNLEKEKKRKKLDLVNTVWNERNSNNKNRMNLIKKFLNDNYN